MGTPHKHAALIKAWADGAEIEYLYRGGWRYTPNPSWSDLVDYRVKPKPHKWQKELDAWRAGKKIQWRISGSNDPWTTWMCEAPNSCVPERSDLADEKFSCSLFSYSEFEWRIKPEPVVKFGNVYDTPTITLHSEETWYHNANVPAYAGAVKFTFLEGKLVAAEVLPSVGSSS